MFWQALSPNTPCWQGCCALALLGHSTTVLFITISDNNLPSPLAGRGDQHAHHWLITGAVLFVKSPDSRFEIRVFEKTEYRMGSPQYGRVDILNSPCDTEGYSLGEILAFSPDSRFLAIDELVSWRRHPRTRVIVFELAAGNEFVAHEQTPGIAQIFPLLCFVESAFAPHG